MRNEKNIRTCLGCFKKADKHKLYKIIRLNKKEAEDSLKKKQVILDDELSNNEGRGSYICSLKCLIKAKTSGMLKKRLRVDISEEEYEEIKRQIEEKAKKA